MNNIRKIAFILLLLIRKSVGIAWNIICKGFSITQLIYNSLMLNYWNGVLQPCVLIWVCAFIYLGRFFAPVCLFGPVRLLGTQKYMESMFSMNLSQCFAFMLIGGDFWKNWDNNSVIWVFKEGSDLVWDSSNGNSISKVNSEATFDDCPELKKSLLDSLNVK